MKKGWRKYEEVGPKTGYTANSALVANYEKAKADNFKNWHIHHRFETHDENGILRDKPLSVKELKEKGLYYNRPASELIWLTNSDHRLLHHLALGRKSIAVEVSKGMIDLFLKGIIDLSWEKLEEEWLSLYEAEDHVLYLKTLGNPDQLQKHLDESTSKLFQLKVCLDVLHEQGVDCDVIEHFYEVEERHNKRLAKLVESNIKGE